MRRGRKHGIHETGESTMSRHVAQKLRAHTFQQAEQRLLIHRYTSVVQAQLEEHGHKPGENTV